MHYKPLVLQQSQMTMSVKDRPLNSNFVKNAENKHVFLHTFISFFSNKLTRPLT